MSIIYKGQTIDTAGKDATLNGVNNLTVKAGNNVTINQDGDILTINAIANIGNSYVLAITFDAAFSGQPYTVTSKDGESYSGTVPTSLKELVTVLYGGTQYTVTSTSKNNGKQYSVNVLTGSAFGQYAASLEATVPIYGVMWDGTSTTKWTRTDNAAGFTDPVPYVDGASGYGSPFDSIMPWAGMVKEERTAGTMVAIPKFWYQLYQNTEGTPSSGMTIRIAEKPVEGFSVSPAHMDRGDGHGERDVVYVGRYHSGSDYKSKTGVLPKTGIGRASTRTEIHKLGSNIWQMDFATRFTIWLLYLVEFSDWNSQERIGYGCGNNSSTEEMGYTDSMPYHTGTTQTRRTVYGPCTQYRNIEGLWDNIYDWVDGCYYNSNGLNVILNPNNFSDTDGGKLAGLPVGGYPSEFAVSNAGGFPMFYPTKADGSDTTFSCDIWNFDASNPCLNFGSNFNHGGFHGLGCVGCNVITDAGSNIGSRLMELPN